MSNLHPAPIAFLLLSREEIHAVLLRPFLLGLRELVQLAGRQPVLVLVIRDVCPETRENAPGRRVALYLSLYLAQKVCAPKSVVYGGRAIRHRAAFASVVTRSV